MKVPSSLSWPIFPPVRSSGVHFESGIDFTIPTGTSIPAGGFFLIAAFENGTALDNSGEMITLLAADDSIIESFRYDDDAPWPEFSDGLGASLTRILSPGSPDADSDLDGINALLEHAYGTATLHFSSTEELGEQRFWRARHSALALRGEKLRAFLGLEGAGQGEY
ncbi:hypothetical protein N9B34_01395 [Akkermansiaceae bacterium]|nr:hypothetical protein [Akkermansiaceae bacterium]MDA8976997.1 hypothetical protein [Akkermansiaceae bacterium]MDB4519652.1 hypothetical protein [Akkermansiaceae bacterium]